MVVNFWRMQYARTAWWSLLTRDFITLMVSYRGAEIKMWFRKNGPLVEAMTMLIRPVVE